jgi:enediyne biosynthesis protein E4
MVKWGLIAVAGWLAASTGSYLTSGGHSVFRDIAADAGLHFQHVNGAAGRYHLPEIMGAGGALLDFDSDGDLDVFLLQGRGLDGNVPSSDPSRGHRLFRNDLSPRTGGASLHFTDVTDRAGFAAGDYGMGAAVGDYDNDGDPDIYVTNYGPNRLYRNNADGSFTDVTARAGEGLDDPRWSTSAAFSDYDADGDLDLFVANYVDFTVQGAKSCFDPAGVRDYCGPLQFRPVPARLFRNNANGTFTDVGESSGITKAFGSGLGVAAGDFNSDGMSDFYVANDARANQLWLNKGDGTFEDGALMAGIALNGEGQAEGSMGLAIGDADNDGDLDIFVTNITGESHAFYVNLGGGRFEDHRVASGLGTATRAYTGFGTDWFDYDNDGLLDLFVANGAVTTMEALRGDPLPFRQKNLLLRNLGHGRFRDVTAEAGPGLEPSSIGRGVAFGDVDNDGDVDVLVTNNAGPVRLLLNQSPPRRAWLEARLEGTADNRQGIGARVGLLTRGGATVWRRAHTDGSYLSASDPRVHFGFPAAADVAGVVVEWPRGSREMWTDLRVNQVVTLKQGTGKRPPARVVLTHEGGGTSP